MSDSFQFFCPHCGNQITTSTRNTGRTGTCNSCKQSLVIPAPATNFRPVLGTTQTGSSNTAGWVLAWFTIAFGLLSFCIPFIGGPMSLVMGAIGFYVGYHQQPIRFTSIFGAAMGTIGMAAWAYILATA